MSLSGKFEFHGKTVEVVCPEIHDVFSEGYRKKGALVKIRPCGSEYENKTHLGIYIGDMARGFSVGRDEEKEQITLTYSCYNPAIFVPALGKVIFGAESWWGVIKTMEDLKEITPITDDVISNVWYMKMLKEQLEKFSE